MSFSKRFGYRPSKKEIQIESMDDDLKNSLWNMIDLSFFMPYDKKWRDVKEDSYLGGILGDLWINHYKKPIIDIASYSCNQMIDVLKTTFMDSYWYDAFDIVEFFVTKEPVKISIEEFVNGCNSILQREFSAYRFVGNKLTRITSKEEIQEVEEAIQSGIDSVKEHLTTSLTMLSDKKSPDYRNSIKESISSVESICKMISGNSSATMTQALTEIEKTGKIELHVDMKDAFQKLYWYTSDADGIRHSLMDGKITPDFDDAKFMLVSCSAIVNYLISKANKAGIKLK